MGITHSKNTKNEDFRISDVKPLKFKKGSDFFHYKLSFEQEDWEAV